MYCRFWVCELGWVESGPVSFRLWWGRLPPRQRSKLSRLRTDLPVEGVARGMESSERRRPKQVTSE